MASIARAAVPNQRVSTAAIECFNGIAVIIATARLTARLAQIRTSVDTARDLYLAVKRVAVIFHFGGTFN
jgi:hypothetical protein